MHAEVIDFLARNAHNARWHNADVVEVGALDVNGRARDCVPQTFRTWTGIDLLDGPGVDISGNAIDLLPLMCQYERGWDGLPAVGPYDIAVCCEVLEHTPQWAELIDAMLTALKPHGVLILTCAGNGRAPHSADGSGSPHPGEHYRNVSLADVLSAVGARANVLVGSELDPPGDTRVVVKKAGRGR